MGKVIIYSDRVPNDEGSSTADGVKAFLIETSTTHLRVVISPPFVRCYEIAIGAVCRRPINNIGKLNALSMIWTL